MPLQIDVSERSVSGVATVAPGGTRLDRPPRAVIAAGQLSLHPPVVLLLEDPQSDLALDQSRLFSGHVSIFGVSRSLRFGRSSQICGRPLANREESLADTSIVLSKMTDIGDSLFHKGQPVWVIQSDGSQQAAEYVGEGEMSAWFGGSPSVIVVYPDHSGGMVEVDRVIAREG